MGAAATVDRIVDAFPMAQQEQIRTVLSVALSCIISQSLIPRLDGKGRVAAFEIMHNTPAVANLIREHKTNRITSVIQTSGKQGMFTLDDHLWALYRKGLIHADEALHRAQNHNDMEKRLLENIATEDEGEEGEGGEKGGDGSSEY